MTPLASWIFLLALMLTTACTVKAYTSWANDRMRAARSENDRLRRIEYINRKAMNGDTPHGAHRTL